MPKITFFIQDIFLKKGKATFSDKELVFDPNGGASLKKLFFDLPPLSDISHTKNANQFTRYRRRCYGEETRDTEKRERERAKGD